MCIRDSTYVGLEIRRLWHGPRIGGSDVLQPELYSYTLAMPVSYTHLRAHETVLDLVCRLLLEKKKRNRTDAGNPKEQ